MSSLTNLNVNMDSNIITQSESVFAELGLDLTTAIDMFLRQSIREGGFPFEVKLSSPNNETLQALQESEQLLADPNTKRYSLEEALKELKS